MFGYMRLSDIRADWFLVWIMRNGRRKNDEKSFLDLSKLWKKVSNLVTLGEVNVMNTQTEQEYHDVDDVMYNQLKNSKKHKVAEDRLWLCLMKFGEKTGCHQRFDRSFFYQGKQFPVCARCTGVLIAYLVSILGYVIVACKRHTFRYPSGPGKQSHVIALFASLTMLIDWTLQAIHVKESTNKRRVITGFLGGLGLMHFYITIYYKIGSYIWKKIKKYV